MSRFLVIGTIFFVVIIIAFYWFLYKPQQIRAKCFAEAEFAPTAVLTTQEVERQKFIDTYYQNCIRRFGIEP